MLFLTPLFSLAATLFHGPTKLAFGGDLQFVGVAISLISVYWGLIFLILGLHFVIAE